MGNNNVIKGGTEEEIWQQIEEQFIQNPAPLEYTAVIEQEGHRIILNIDIDLGGGFESGYETTSITAPLQSPTDFRFAIHEEHFTDEIGKFFGMQDVIIGYEKFDKKLVVKTNDELKVRGLFSDESVRAVFQVLENFSLGITTHHTSDSTQKDPYLECNIETGITDVNKLHLIYKAFYTVLCTLNKL
ncbi:MAG: hypothetical protein M3040_00225 [Bacteroidota bacterium]|nr:hypothetical protein [Bacteroidota bacterium]